MALKFCVVGDSLAQGFQDLAVGDPTWSFPAIMARAAGQTPGTTARSEFRVPAVPTPSLPIDVYAALANAERAVGPTIDSAAKQARLLRAMYRYGRAVKRFYERGAGRALPEFPGVYHNLGLFGMTTFEAAHLDAVGCEWMIAHAPFLKRHFPLPSASQYRIARWVLNPDGKRPRATQLDNLDFLVNGRPELGIAAEPLDAVILWLGANDCLGTVVDLQVTDMENHDPGQTVAERRRFNLTSQAQFERDFRTVADRVQTILRHQNTQVFVATVPDVTIPPLVRGIRRGRAPDFAFYARFFVPDDASRLLHETLSVKEIEHISRRVASYNATIARIASEKSWTLVPMHDVLNRLAVRRRGCEDDPGRPLRAYYAACPDHPLLGLDPIPSLLMLRTAEDGRRIAGGLTSLDGVHPSTAGYGIVAEVLLEALSRAGIADADPQQIPWRDVIAADRCLARGPALWNDVADLFTRRSAFWDLLFRPMSARL